MSEIVGWVNQRGPNTKTHLANTATLSTFWNLHLVHVSFVNSSFIIPNCICSLISVFNGFGWFNHLYITIQWAFLLTQYRIEFQYEK